MHLYYAFSDKTSPDSANYWRVFYNEFLHRFCLGSNFCQLEIPAELEYVASVIAAIVTTLFYLWMIISEVVVSGLACNIVFQVSLQFDRKLLSNLNYSEFKFKLEMIIKLLGKINLNFRFQILTFTTTTATLFCKFFRIAFRGNAFHTTLALSYLLVCFSFLTMAAEGERRLVCTN